MLGLGASISTATSVGSWNPSRLPGLLMWFRFNHGITLDAQDDVTKWDNQSNDRNIGDINGTTDGGATTSPVMRPDGAMYFDNAANFLRFKTSGGSNYELNLGTFSMYFRLKFDSGHTIDAEDLVEKDGSNFFKIASATSTRCKIGGTRADWTHDEISVNTKFTIGFERNSSNVCQSYVNGTAGVVDEGEGTIETATTLDLIQFGKPVADNTSGTGSHWYEIVICDNALSTENRSLLNSYLDTL